MDQVHSFAREHFKIPTKKDTYLGEHKRGLLNGETTVGDIHDRQKANKKSITLYLHYPKPYADIEFTNMTLSIVSSDEEDGEELRLAISASLNTTTPAVARISTSSGSSRASTQTSASLSVPDLSPNTSNTTTPAVARTSTPSGSSCASTPTPASLSVLNITSNTTTPTDVAGNNQYISLLYAWGDGV